MSSDVDASAVVSEAPRRLPRSNAAAAEVVLAAAAAAAFVALAFRSAMRLPPTFDLARGLWLEAAYLADTNFNYARLMEEEPGNDAGAARNYVYTLAPGFIALLMRATSSPVEAVVAYRIASLLAAAAAAALVYRTLRTWLAAPVAALFAAWFLTTPVFLAQAAIVGFEAPLALAAAAVLSLLAAGRRLGALGAVAVGVAWKLTALVMAVAYVAALCGRAAADRRLPSRRRWPWAVLGGCLVAGPVARALLLPYPHHQNPLQTLGFKSLWVTCPDVLSVAVLVATAGAALAVQAAKRGAMRGRSEFSIVDLDRATVLCFSLAHVLLTASFCRLFGYLPRYLASAAPSFVVLAGGLIALHPRGGRLAVPVLSLLLGINLANLHGRWLPKIDLPGEAARVLSPWHERSLEWTGILRTNAKSLSDVCTKHPDALVVAPVGVGHALATPRLGFVLSPREGYVHRFHSVFYDTLTNFDLDGLVRKDTATPKEILVFGARTAGGGIAAPLPFEEGDEIVWDEGGEGLVVFQKLWRPKLTSVGAYSRWIRNPNWPGETPAVALERRLRAMCALGPAATALREASAVLRSGLPSDVQFAALMAIVEAGVEEDAEDLLRRLGDAGEPQLAQFFRGVLELRAGRPESASQTMAPVMPLFLDNAYAQFQFGRSLFDGRRFDEAEAAFLRCTQLPRRPGDRRLIARARTYLGDLYWLAGDAADAVAQWRLALGVESERLLDRLRLHVENHAQTEIEKGNNRLEQIRQFAEGRFRPPVVWPRAAPSAKDPAVHEGSR
jgi:hypothetical protein